MIGAKRYFETFSMGGIYMIAALATLAVGIACFPGSAAAQQDGQKTFSASMDASKALVAAVQADDQTALLSILGPDSKDILSSGDEVEDKNDRENFVNKYQQTHRLVNEPDGTATLYIGAENWPTPIPLVHKESGWYFDTAAGKQEILYRRIGKNELAAIQVCRELVDAEKEYYGQPHDGDAGNQYAQKFLSGPGKHDGLYWQATAGQAESPIGPLVAAAATEGYIADANKSPQPFQGYYYRILTGQGAKAAGGAKDYVVAGKMIRGFAFVAYPDDYRSSGVMTFIVDQDGVVYQKDLGPRTGEIAKALTRYDRDRTWRKAD